LFDYQQVMADWISEPNLNLLIGYRKEGKRLSKDRVQKEEKTQLYKVLPSKLMPLWTEVTQYINNHYKEANQT
jgi:hypothetical protein